MNQNPIINKVLETNSGVLNIENVINYITQQPPYTYMWYKNDRLRVDGVLTKEELEAIWIVINDEYDGLNPYI